MLVTNKNNKLIISLFSLPLLMVGLNILNDTLITINKKIDSYKARKRTIIQAAFATDTVSILPKTHRITKSHSVWLNALWAVHNADHNADISTEENHPEHTLAWLTNKGTYIIQTDRPKELLKNLITQKFHNYSFY